MKITIRAVLTSAAASFSVPAFAQSLTHEYSLEFECQQLSAALTEFSKQMGLLIRYLPETLNENASISPHSGRPTADVSIPRLPVPSGLSFEQLNERTIAVTGPKSLCHGFSTVERKTDAPLSPSLARLASLRLAEGPSTDDDDLQVRTTANAEESDSNKRLAGALEEVIVTAQKREERLQDVPISISVLSGEELDTVRGTGLLEALAAAPGVTIRENAQGSTTSLSIRGVNATSPLFNGSSPIGFYLDSLPFGFVRSAAVPDLNPYDLDRVEVLRGPQGTLYGANSLNGVVRVLTKEANLNDFSIKGLASVSSTSRGGTNYTGDMAVNVPLIAGRLAARAVAGYEDRDGWIDTPNRQDVNATAVSNVRIKVKAQPIDDLSLGLTVWRSRTHSGAPSISDDQDRRTTDDNEDNHTKFDTYNLAINYALPEILISSMTSYLKFSNDSYLSLDVIFPPDFPLFDTDIRAKNLSQELLLSSNTLTKWRWSSGVFYRSAQEDLFQVLSGNDLTYKSESVAFFGQLTRMLIDDQFEVSAGLRYFEDRVTYQDNPGTINLAPPFVKSSDRFDKLSPKATISWYLNPDTTVYISYGEGFRSGFSQFSTVTRQLAPDFPPAGPDELNNYELGTKGSLANSRLDFEAAVFYIDWRDTQQVVTYRDVDSPAGFPTAINTGTIDGIGFDVALKARPLRGLELGVNYSWNDLAFRTPILSGGEILFDKGFRPPDSAEKTIGGLVRYSLPMRNGWIGHAETTANYTSPLIALSLADGVPNSQSGQSILVARCALSVETSDRWMVMAYVDNLTNTRRFTAQNGFQEWKSRIRPRTVGLQFEYGF